MKTKTDWEYIKNIKDSEIDYFDILEADADFLENAKIVYPASKEGELANFC